MAPDIYPAEGALSNQLLSAIACVEALYYSSVAIGENDWFCALVSLAKYGVSGVSVAGRRMRHACGRIIALERLTIIVHCSARDTYFAAGNPEICIVPLRFRGFGILVSGVPTISRIFCFTVGQVTSFDI